MIKLNPPLFSIIIATYNRAHLLDRAVRSVIAQKFPSWELILVDDGSIDDTRQVLEKFVSIQRISCHFRPHKGLAASRNFGAGKAQGTFLTFLDSDDEYQEGHLALRAEQIKRHPEIDFFHGGVSVIGSPYLPDAEDPEKKVHVSQYPLGGTFFVRRSIFLELGGFPERGFAEDLAFFKIISASGCSCQKLDFPTYVYYRTEKDSLTNNWRGEKRESDLQTG